MIEDLSRITATARNGLRAGWLGRSIEVLEECASTSDRAAELARAGAPSGACVIADRQTRGRGRLGRVWSSPAGDNLYLSIVLRPERSLRDLPPLALACGIAIAETAALFGVATLLKWPNDVLAGAADVPGRRPRKLAGVLLESATAAGALSHVVVGVGLNVNTLTFEGELGEIATSLRRERGAREPLLRDLVANALLERLESWIDRFLSEGVAPVILAFRERAYGIGRQIVVAGASPGVFEDLAPDGALLLRTQAGALERVLAGEITLM